MKYNLQLQKMMNKKRILLFAILHLVITFGCLIVSFSASMQHFDDLKEPAWFENALSYTADVLMLPLRLIWTSWMSKHLHSSIEWLLFLSNSLLWGLAIEFLYLKIKSL